MTSLTGDEIVAVYSGPAGNSGAALGRKGSTSLTISGLASAPNLLKLALMMGGQTMTVAQFLTLVADNARRPHSNIRVGIASNGGLWFSPQDYHDYVNINTVPGILESVMIEYPGTGYSVGDNLTLDEADETNHRGHVRVQAVDHLGAITDAAAISPYFYLNGSVSAHAGDGDGSSARFFATVSRDTVTGVIRAYGIDTDGEGDKWARGDAITVDNGTGTPATGVVWDIWDSAAKNSVVNLPPFEVVSADAGSSSAITAVTQGTGTIQIAGDKTDDLPPDRVVTIVGGPNAGTYFVSAQSFATGHTTVVLRGPPHETITLTDLPADGNYVNILNSQHITFRTASPGLHECLIGADVTETAANLVVALTTYFATVLVNEATPAVRFVATSALGVVTVTFPQAFNVGTPAFAKSGANITLSGVNLAAKVPLPSATVAGNLVLGPAIVMKADNGGADLNDLPLWRFGGIFNESPDVPKMLSGLDPVGSSGDVDFPDLYTFYVSPYSAGTLSFLNNPAVVQDATAKPTGPIAVADLHVFGDGFVADEAHDIVGVGDTGSLLINSVLDYGA